MIGRAKVCLAFLVITSLVVILLVEKYGFGAEVTVNATAGNVAPTVGTVTITPSQVSPGTTFYVAANVSDSNGKEDIIQVNVSCFGTGGVEWTDSWDSLKHLNDSYITWSEINTTTWLVNATFNTSVNYWSTKSINGTWTCKIYVNDSGGLSAVNSNTMTVTTYAGVSLYASSCVFDSGSPGATGKQWACPSDRNNTVLHEGNTWLNVTINATDLIGKTDPSWFIGFGNMTWNQTTGAVPTSKQGYQFTGSPMDFITFWSRGDASTRTYNTTNATLWLDYPSPLYLQTYEGNITFNALVA
ncbi:MAG: hypothetical protein QW403_03335 [Candidatus Aenigmatarchaeota archaeon]